jgi:threonyl-tRNA synthetase
MRILQLDVDFVEYELVKPEIKNYEECESKRVRVEDALVLLTSIEKGDTEEEARRAVKDAVEFANSLKRGKLVIYPYAHLSSNLEEPGRARELLESMLSEAEKYGLVVTHAPFGWNKKLTVSTKSHPFAEQGKTYSVLVDGEKGAGPKRESVEKRAKSAFSAELTVDQMLARLRKSDFSGLPETDHRVIGEKLDLFSFQEASPGMVYWHDKGVRLRDLLVNFIKSELKKRGYLEISTAALANTALWRVSGHWDHYKDNMFLTKLGDEEFGLKPMNCPSTFLVYKSRRWSYRDLPLRIADFDQLFRNELSGVTSGLFRVKIFTQDDAHIFAAEGQVKQVLSEQIEFMRYLYGVFKLDYKVKISTMPEKRLGTEEQWSEAIETLVSVVRENGLTYEMKEAEGAFYGPKIDVDIKDSMGREWQCATVQLDYQMPKRFGLTYMGEDGKEHTPAVIHRVIYGSLERFIGIIIEHFQGNLPVWLSPVQARVVSISEATNEYAKRVYERLDGAGIRAEVDVSNKTLDYKIREAQLMKIPYILVVGRKEADSNTVALRVRGGEQKFGIRLEEFIERINHETEERVVNVK